MNGRGCGCSSVCCALALGGLLLSVAAWGQLPRPTRTDQANNHLRIKEWMFGARIGRTVTVATAGGDYTTLAAAAAYVTTQTPSAVAPWVILIYNGDHSAAPVALPAWTSAVFLGGIDDEGDRSGLAVRTGTGFDFALKVTGATNIAGGGGAGNYFETIDAPAGTDPVADAADDTLILTCTGGLTCTGNATTDTVTLALPADDDVPEGGDFGALALTGPVTSSGLATTIAADAVTLGTQTAGGYAASATEGGAASSVAANAVALGTDTTGGYAASTTEAGPATTATALAANGGNCTPGSYPLGVDAAGAVEGCTAAGSGTIGGTLGTAADAIPVANGTGGLTAKASTVTITSGAMQIPDGAATATGLRFGSMATGTGLFGSSASAIAFSYGGATRWTISNASITSQSGSAFYSQGTGLPVFMPGGGDLDSGLGANAADDMAMYAGGAGVERWLRVAGISRSIDLGQAGDTPQAATCADSGDASPGALTINPTTAIVYLTVSDADGCTVTMGETNVASGLRVDLVTVAGSATYADTSGVTELAGGFTAATWDVLRLRYVADRWVETGRSDN